MISPALFKQIVGSVSNIAGQGRGIGKAIKKYNTNKENKQIQSIINARKASEKMAKQKGKDNLKDMREHGAERAEVLKKDFGITPSQINLSTAPSVMPNIKLDYSNPIPTSNALGNKTFTSVKDTGKDMMNRYAYGKLRNYAVRNRNKMTNKRLNAYASKIPGADAGVKKSVKNWLDVKHNTPISSKSERTKLGF